MSFWFCWLLASVAVSGWFGWKAIRKSYGIARGNIMMCDLSLYEVKKYSTVNLEAHPAFGHPMTIVSYGGRPTSEIGQFFRRWLLYYPLSWLANFVSPFNWIFALPMAFFIWIGG